MLSPVIGVVAACSPVANTDRLSFKAMEERRAVLVTKASEVCGVHNTSRSNAATAIRETLRIWMHQRKKLFV
jgi:hypothetical protein